MSNWFENHQPQRTQISTVGNAPYIQNSNQMASSVNVNRKFSERILSTPAIFKATSNLFGSQGCSDDKNWLDFSGIFFKIGRRFADQFCLCCKFSFHEMPSKVKFDSGVIFLDQSQFFATHSNQWDCVILYRQQITSNGFFRVCRSGQRSAFE